MLQQKQVLFYLFHSLGQICMYLGSILKYSIGTTKKFIFIFVFIFVVVFIFVFAFVFISFLVPTSYCYLEGWGSIPHARRGINHFINSVL